MRITHVVATTALVVLAVAGCGSDSDSNSDDAATSPTSAATSASGGDAGSDSSSTTKSGVTRSGSHFGVVKWFSDSKGFGFIAIDGGEIYVAASALRGLSTLKEGQQVAFDIVNGPKGRQAADVHPYE